MAGDLHDHPRKTLVYFESVHGRNGYGDRNMGQKNERI